MQPTYKLELETDRSTLCVQRAQTFSILRIVVQTGEVRDLAERTYWRQTDKLSLSEERLYRIRNTVGKYHLDIPIEIADYLIRNRRGEF